MVLDLETTLAQASMTGCPCAIPTRPTTSDPPATGGALAGFDWNSYLKAVGAPAFEDPECTPAGFFSNRSPPRCHPKPITAFQAYFSYHLLARAAAEPAGSVREREFRFSCSATCRALRSLARVPTAAPPWWTTSSAICLGRIHRDGPSAPTPRRRSRNSSKHSIGSGGRHPDASVDDRCHQESGHRQACTPSPTTSATPGKWRDYSKVSIVRDDLFGNSCAPRRPCTAQRIVKIGQPTTRPSGT